MNNFFFKKFQDVFSLDLRSLALFRMALALMILADLYKRCLSLRAHYTDEGILPREIIHEFFQGPIFSPFHMLGGSFGFQLFLFIFAGSLAILLFLGYRTRWVTFLSWIFLYSLQERNGLILHQADSLLLVTLFWGIFLPLGARYSMDQALNSSNEKIPDRIFSVGSIAFVLQIFLIYFTATLFKLQYDEWHNGSVLFNVLSIDTYVKSFGKFLLNFPLLLKFLSYFALLFEGLFPLLILIPFFMGHLRTWLIIAFLYFHLGIWMCLSIGLFQPISIMSVLPLLPAWFWQRLDSRWDRSIPKNTKIYYDGDCGFCKKGILILKTFFLLPTLEFYPAQTKPDKFNLMQKENSWIFEDDKGKVYLRFQVFVKICEFSSIFFIIVPLLKISPISWIGEKIYKFVANHRILFSSLLRWLSYRPLKIRMSMFPSIFVAICLGYVFIYNFLAVVHLDSKIPNPLRRLGNVFRLNQSWNMFDDVKQTLTGWIVLPGKLKDKTFVELLSGNTLVSDQIPKPDLVSKQFINHNWRLFWWNMVQPKFRFLSDYVGGYLCRQWNQENPHKESLHWVKAFYIEKGNKVHKLFLHRCVYP